MYRFGIFGHPIHHSLSPRMHGASFKSLGLEATYEAFDVEFTQLRQQLEFCLKAGFTGLNITIPHKTAIIPMLTRVDALAAHVGAVNTIHFEGDGVMTGYNTDIIGFQEDLREGCGVTPVDKRVLVLGCGGAGRAITFACAGASEIYLADPMTERAEILARDMQVEKQRHSRVATVHILPPQQQSWAEIAPSCDLIVHCTPAGLKPEDTSVLPISSFRPGQTVYDLVTNPNPPTLATALTAGAKGTNGIGMLVRQGAASFKIWTGRDADIAAMRAAIT
jgi:shikimate dehydrogenase